MIIWVVFKSLKKVYQAKKSFIVLWQEKNTEKEYVHVPKAGSNLKWEQRKAITTYT